MSSFKPEILAPAGDGSSFLAALAAGADAAYVGLKHFSARAGADNFSLTELSRMVDLANSEGRKVFIAFNSLVKPGEMDAAGRLMLRLARDVKPHAVILQDPGLIELARQAGFEGEIHLSTLANLTHPKALEVARELGASRVILPRELSIDEIRQTAQSAPEGMGLELFVHGALCWCVSGRCYWSSYMGGKSGLRGRCVQPCRRVYRQKGQGRFFSCRDLSLDALVKTLADIPNLVCWKIEGRKKGPHYVYHAVAAYKLLRDAFCGGAPDETSRSRLLKDVEDLLEMALGRPRTKALFLPQRGQPVATPDEPTSSGLLVGKIQFEQAAPEPAKKGKARPDKSRPDKSRPDKSRPETGIPFFKPRIDLLPQDLLRIGYEDEPWHDTVPVTRRTPKAGAYRPRLAKHKTPKAGTPVFLIDRREPELAAELAVWEKRLASARAVQTKQAEFTPRLPAPAKRISLPDVFVRPSLPHGKEGRVPRSARTGLWFSPNTVRAVSRTVAPRISWWLPPVIWPDEEAACQKAVIEALRNGARYFVCNAPWQRALFDGPLRGDVHLTAGPFCNVANAASVAVLAALGFEAAVVSPELPEEDFLALPRQSCLPLGVVIAGFWPVGVSRHNLVHLKANEPFQSPKGETFWARNYGENLWIYPGWPLDLTAHRPELEAAGYAFFATLDENVPAALPATKRPGEFNWKTELL